MGIKSFHLINNVFEQIIQHNVGSLQTLLEAHVEQTVISIHLIVAFRIFFPDAFCFCGMESGRMFLKETLQIRHLQNTVIKIFKWLIPYTSSPFFNGIRNGIHINDMIADLRHQLCQNHFVDTWEAFRSHQIIHSQLFKSLMQTGFILNITCYIIQLLLVFTVKPFRNKIVAICLVRYRN